MKALPQAIAGANFHIGIIAGKVERRDAGNHAKRLAQRIHVDPRPGAVGELALQQMRNAAGELAHLDAALDVAVASGTVLPCSRDSSSASSSLCWLHQVDELEHDPGAHLRVLGSPSGLCSACVFDCGAHLVRRCQRHFGLHFAGIGIIDVAEPSALALNVLAADKMSDFLAHGSLSAEFSGCRI